MVIGVAETNISDSIVPILLTAFITLGITILAQWILTNWRIKREFRIKLLKETFNPLYKLASDALEKIESMYGEFNKLKASENIRIIISDVRFSMLKEAEQTTVKQVEQILSQYENVLLNTQRTLKQLWENIFLTLIRNIPGPSTITTGESPRTIRDRIKDVFKEGVWTIFMDQTQPTASDLIQEANLEQTIKTQLLELDMITIQTFEATQEYKTYLKTQYLAIQIIKNFKDSLTKWVKEMFSLTSR